MMIWTGTKANGKTTEIKIKDGTEAQREATAKALHLAGYKLVADENGRHIFCQH